MTTAPRSFFGGVNNDDVLHTKMADKTSLPLDGRVERIMDIGCAIGQFSCALKKRFPEAEVWGTDIGAPMVRCLTSAPLGQIEVIA